MIPTGRLFVGKIIKRYDHGYIVIWDYDRDRGVESTDSSYQRVSDLCPGPDRLLGTLAIYSETDNRSARWFTAFSPEQLELLVERERKLDAKLSRPDAARAGIIKAISQAKQNEARSSQGQQDFVVLEAPHDLNYFDKSSFEKAWNQRFGQITISLPLRH